MWQTKYSLAIPKNLGVGVDFWQCSECDFRSPFTGPFETQIFNKQ